MKYIHKSKNFMSQKEDLWEKNFDNDLSMLRNFYPKNILGIIENNKKQLMSSYICWQEAVLSFASKLKIQTEDTNKIPDLLEQFTYKRVKEKFKKNKQKKFFLGIAGPGAVGKETIKNKLGFSNVINTTTRPKRAYEIQGEHYHFVSEKVFSKLSKKEEFVVNMKRRGRGNYGIQKRDIEETLNKNEVSIIEENPSNLILLRDYIKSHKNCEFILIYILPPSPVLLHLAARLASRCERAGEDFTQTFKSTLGMRQLEEFGSLLLSISVDADIIFIVNNEIKYAVRKIKNLIS